MDSMLVCPAVTTCPNAMTALDRLRDRRQHFDLVLSDVYMPGKPGPCIGCPQAVPGCLAAACHVCPLKYVSCHFLAMKLSCPAFSWQDRACRKVVALVLPLCLTFCLFYRHGWL